MKTVIFKIINILISNIETIKKVFKSTFSIMLILTDIHSAKNLPKLVTLKLVMRTTY